MLSYRGSITKISDPADAFTFAYLCLKALTCFCVYG